VILFLLFLFNYFEIALSVVSSKTTINKIAIIREIIYRMVSSKITIRYWWFLSLSCIGSFGKIISQI
jgi:hypothetical protein